MSSSDTEGNRHPAKVFLDTKNRDALDRNLQDNFDTNINELRKQDNESQEIILRIREKDLPKLKITRTVATESSEQKKHRRIFS